MTNRLSWRTQKNNVEQKYTGLEISWAHAMYHLLLRTSRITPVPGYSLVLLHHAGLYQGFFRGGLGRWRRASKVRSLGWGVWTRPENFEKLDLIAKPCKFLLYSVGLSLLPYLRKSSCSPLADNIGRFEIYHLRNCTSPLRTEVYICHQNQNAKNIGNFTTLLKPHNIGTHLKGIGTSFQVVSLFLNPSTFGRVILLFGIFSKG
jgi:hypothetical protein